MSAKTNPDAEFAYGAGHINPMKAVDPGLVYDANELDYIKTVTNVGSAVCNYKAVVTCPPGSGIQVGVVPSVLNFTALGQKLSFEVDIRGSINTQEDPIKSASLVWDDGVHQVRSPIVVYAPS
ncbi:hypothetical protein RJ639_036898 [Escallonia herrerae]|uniref:Subtilisin-like protease fibronectin type-III domain-containing protein n=1 Tax=Escallonia herrerae TaxID=1293975 RepID=A0AA89B9I8_9ASTE|nr:hypothetical protein RJ639_036898 [Escallonia herrerae]